GAAGRARRANRRGKRACRHRHSPAVRARLAEAAGGGSSDGPVRPATWRGGSDCHSRHRPAAHRARHGRRGGTTWISNQTLADMTLHSFLTSARDLSAKAWRWTRRNGHALAVFTARHARRAASYVHARTHAAASVLHARSAARPATAIAVLLVGGVALGAGATQGLRSAQLAQLQASVEAQQAGMDDTRREARREVNALAARLGELQAEANRLNALGERLTRIGQLGDGEFDFNKPVGVGGEGPVRDIAAGELRGGMDKLGAQLG